MRRFFTNQVLAEGFLEIDGEEARHMQTVLRLNAGDACLLVNHCGQVARASVCALGKNTLTLKVEDVRQGADKPFRLAILQGYLKERKLDDLIRPLSELGVAEFGAVFTERSVPRPDEKRLAARLERWRKLAVEALKQCRDTELLQVCEVSGLLDALTRYANYDLKLLLWEGAETGLYGVLEQNRELNVKSAVLLLGPEGGFSAREAALACEHGFVSVSLGARILRAQTAAMASAAVVQYALGDFGRDVLSDL